MRRAGRVSPLLLVAILGAAALAMVLFFNQESPGEAGARFMDALARGDVKQLTADSYAPGKSQEELSKDWQFATQVASKHYLFFWTIVSSTVQSEDSAVVKVQVQRNFGPGSYDENYGLPLHKRNGKWKVDASGISREMYPALPRSGSDEKAAAGS